MKFLNLKKKLKISYSIQDETLKKYVLEDFLEKIKKLTQFNHQDKIINIHLIKRKKIIKFLKKQNFCIKKEKIYQEYK